nr:hypothetical protein [Tanacetum cinerariifolium]
MRCYELTLIVHGNLIDSKANVGKLWNECYKLELSMVRCLSLGGAAARTRDKRKMWLDLWPRNGIKVLVCWLKMKYHGHGGNQPNNNAGIKENLNVDADVADAAFDVKENENEVHVFPSRIDKTKKHDEKAKRDDRGKSLVDSPTGVKDLRAEFEEFSINSTNRVNAVSAPVAAAGPNPTNSTNSTNSFNTASPSDTTVSPNFGIARKSSFMDPSKYPDDLDMPELEDIVYSDDEEDVGAELDFSNLETNIPVTPIPTTRVHKDHPVT